MDIDRIDKDILNSIQGDFPISPDPYGEIGASIGVSGHEVLERVKRLLENGVIRKVGPFFDAKKMGYRSTLCAVDIPDSRLEPAASVINSFPQVTHNYLREGTPNIWFTVIAESHEAIARILNEIESKGAVGPIRNLPALRMFKVKVDLKISG